jgi:hypothetical protein
MGCHPNGSVPCARQGVSRSSLYQMTTSIDKARGEGNCAGATRCGEEACECSIGVAAGSVLASAARLRTETFYQAGQVGRVSQTSRSRSLLIRQVKNELVQRQITLLSGEICRDGLRAVAAPGSKACLKAGNGRAQAVPGAAEVSRGRSTGDRRPTIPGRTER